MFLADLWLLSAYCDVVTAASYRADIKSITADALTLVQGTSASDSERKLGKRLSGTATFAAPAGSRRGLAVLWSPDFSRPDWYLAEILPGGTLVQPLLRFDNGEWAEPGNLQKMGRRELLQLADFATDEGQCRSMVAFARATAANRTQAMAVRKRATTPDAVFSPCLDIYDAWVDANPAESRLSRLTDHLTGASAQTKTVIQARSQARHIGSEDERFFASVVNSLRRSAGTNYQGLVALAIAEELAADQSTWYVHYPPPREYMRDLAIRFTGSADLAVDIDADIDILIKNAAWEAAGNGDEPVVMLSVKTSLADRAGAAARWKMYFDVATRKCPFEKDLEGCAWHDQGLRFAKPDVKIRLAHCIVTANIYKMGSDTRFAEQGELGTAQTKANTFMFDRRFATRVGEKVEMTGWEPLTGLRDLLVEMSDAQRLPH